jgi:hypothetical protein
VQRAHSPKAVVAVGGPGVRRVPYGLGYPECCIDAQQQENADFEDALVRGWTRLFGDDSLKELPRHGTKIERSALSSSRKPLTECLAYLSYFHSCSTLLVNLA